MRTLRHRTHLRRAGGVLVAAAVVLGGLASAGSAVASTPTAPTPASSVPGVAHQIKVRPLVSIAPKAADSVQFGCQTRPLDGSQGLRCYAPNQIQKAYGLSPLLSAGITGKGRTIVIVDAFQNPYIKTDLAAFDATFSLPAPTFQQIAPLGLTPFNPDDNNMVGWAEEISLDVQWAHATAPGAKIVLALAPSNNDSDLYATTKYVVDHNIGDVISQSFGEAEQCMAPSILNAQHALFAEAAKKKISVFASSGDSGASQFNCAGTGAILAASTPASDPNVTGVGGTTLDAGVNGNYIGEAAWTEFLLGCNPPALDPSDINCSGGGFSTIYSRPSYQAGVPNTRPGSRGVPDVSYNAGVNGGVLTHCGICNLVDGYDPTDPSIFFLFGGTSSGSPQWSGLTAVGDQLGAHRLGLINPALYAISHSPQLYAGAFHDITLGDNDVAEIGTGYKTAKNWDPVTGLGTPNAVVLLPLLAAATA